ncbi:DoxX family protein [Flectobacillus major]|uniref:DoxX family protein n=1 Tax=Flectobacillus major TaxID=103 RepID=UPI0004007FA5|nr:DoxX family protein [Flectobacillus major]
MKKYAVVLQWAAQIIAAIILLQTLFFKFTAAPESVYIFSKLGIEPYGRIGSGIAELIAALLLLIPRTAILGALLSLGIISGAIVAHLAILGIEIQDDGGLLFAYALIVFFCNLFTIWSRRNEIIYYIATF